MRALTATDRPDTWVQTTHTEPPAIDEGTDPYPRAVRWALNYMRVLDQPTTTCVVVVHGGVADAHFVPTSPPAAEDDEPPVRRDRRTEVIGAVAEIAETFDLPRKEVLLLGGVQERTYYTWESGGTPQPRTIRTLRRLHAIARIMRQRLGDNAVDWLNAGDPSPRDLLRSGDLDSVEHRTRLIGRHVDHRNPYQAVGAFDDID